MSRDLSEVLEGLKDVQEVFDMDDRLFEAGEAGMTMLIEQDQLLRDILAAQIVQPYRGWNIGLLNKAVGRTRAYLGLPSVHDLNPDIKAMSEAIKARFPEPVSLAELRARAGFDSPEAALAAKKLFDAVKAVGGDPTPCLPNYDGMTVLTRCDGMAVDRGDSPRRRWPNWLPRIGILPSMTVGLGRDDDEFDGRVLVIQWGRFVFEIFLGRRA